MTDVFLELSLIIVLVAAVSLVMKLLRQPLIIGYILTGVLVGPTLLNAVQADDTINIFASFGVALLLFIIGLGLNPRVIKEVGKVAVLTGVGQVIFTTGVGWLIVFSLGYSPIVALYIAIALAFSSTIIILKLISDKKEQHRLYGKISIGFLLVQDILAALALVAISASSNGGLAASSLLWLLIKGLLVVSGILIAAIWILPKIRGLFTGSQELLFIFALAWGFGIASLFRETGFSLEVGALAAGIALAPQTYAAEISARLRPLRDFFIVMFFVSLGTHIQIEGALTLLPQALLLSSFVLIGNPIIVMMIMGFLNFTKKTSFKAGLAVAQISEFSLVFILLAGRLDQVDSQVVSLVTIIGIITIAASSYMITYADQLYDLLAGPLSVFERRHAKHETERRVYPELVLIGSTKGGEQFIKAFKAMKKRYLVLDYDPVVIDRLEHENIPNTYGDVTNIELLEELCIYKAQLVVSMMSDFTTNAFLVNYLAQTNPKAVIICSADTPGQAADLYAEGASYVMMPHYIGSEQIVSFIRKSGLKQTAFKEFKAKHLLRLRREFADHYSQTRQEKQLGRSIMDLVHHGSRKKSKKKKVKKN